MRYKILAQRRDGTEEVREITSGERYDSKWDADHMASLLQDHSRTTDYFSADADD